MTILDPILRGRFQQGYDNDDFRRVATEIKAVTGAEIVCIWQYFDDFGYGGDSEFYLVDGGRLYELAGDLWPWLSADARDLEAPESPGDSATWQGSASAIEYENLSGDGWNYALEFRD